MDISAPVEDYLKTVFHLEANADEGAQPDATVSAVARVLGVTKPSASAMVKRLQAAGLTVRDAGGRVCLTEEGRTIALRIVRRHRLIETFLADVLGMEWHEVHTEAEVLEHALSDRLEARIDAYLGHPNADPHGDPIPPPLGVHDESWPSALSASAAGSRFLVERVLSHDGAALRYLAGLGIRPGVELDILRHDPFGGPIWVRIDGDESALGTQLSEIVRGEVVECP